MNNSTVFMLIGLPCTGKSYWTNQKKEDAIIASSDDYIQFMCDNNGYTYNEGFSLYTKDAQDHFFNVIKNAVNNKQNVIIDRTNLTKSGRKKILKYFDNYTKIAVIFNPKEEIHNQYIENRRNKIIPTHVIQNMRNNMDFDVSDEGFDEVIHIYKEGLNTKDD